MKSQRIEFWPKPAEATPRQVKNAVVAAFALYALAFFALVSGDLGGALMLAMMGIMVQKVVVPVVKWYLTG